MNQGQSLKTYTKYINRQLWKEALTSRHPTKKLEQFFNQYHKKQDQLQMAIDNLNLKYFPDLLQYCLGTLVFLSMQSLPNNLYNIEQILESSKFSSVFSKELNIMQKKINRTRDVQDFQKTIDQFLKFAENSKKLQIKQLPLYLNQLESTVIILMRNSSNLNQYFQQIQLLKNSINNLNDNLIIQNSINFNDFIQPEIYQRQNSQKIYQPRNYQVDYIQVSNQYRKSISRLLKSKFKLGIIKQFIKAFIKLRTLAILTKKLF